MPRTMRIPFYHLLASLFMAGVLVSIASILRAKFGWAAFAGFLLAPAIEPMFTGLAPNLYWLAANWLLPIPFAMLLADEEDERRRRLWLGLAFLAFLMKFLSGYEFTSTMILAAAVACLLTVNERPDLFRHVLRNASWVVVVGVSAFIVAAIMHGAKEGGFAVFAQKAANRILGNSPSLEEALIFGKFQPIGAVLSLYLGGNLVTLTKSFGLVLALIAMYAILVLLDERFNWFYSEGRRKLQILALATLASFTAPLSWFILAKAHSWDHLLYDLAMWYVPTIPFGFAMFGVGSVSLAQYLKLKRGDALLSLTIASIPLVIVGVAVAIRLIDKKIETAGTWVITEHANAFPVFEDPSLGIEFRMSNQWFTLLYPCSARPPNRTFEIKAEQDGKTTNYDFEEDKQLVLSSGGQCLAAQAKSDRPIARMHIGETSSAGRVWNRDVTLSLPELVQSGSFHQRGLGPRRQPGPDGGDLVKQRLFRPAPDQDGRSGRDLANRPADDRLHRFVWKFESREARGPANSDAPRAVSGLPHRPQIAVAYRIKAFRIMRYGRQGSASWASRLCARSRLISSSPNRKVRDSAALFR